MWLTSRAVVAVSSAEASFYQALLWCLTADLRNPQGTVDLTASINGLLRQDSASFATLSIWVVVVDRLCLASPFSDSLSVDLLFLSLLYFRGFFSNSKPSRQHETLPNSYCFPGCLQWSEYLWLVEILLRLSYLSRLVNTFELIFSALECFACDNGAFGERCINQPASIENGFIKCQDDKTHCYTSKLEDKPDGSKATSNKSQAKYRTDIDKLSVHFPPKYHYALKILISWFLTISLTILWSSAPVKMLITIYRANLADYHATAFLD